MPKSASRDAKSLGISSIEQRHQLLSQTRHYYAKKQSDIGIKEPAPPVTKPAVAEPFVYRSPPPDSVRLVGEAAADRRVAIKYVFQAVLQSPPKEAWLELETIPYIMRVLGMPKGSFGTVCKVLEKLLVDPKANVGREKAGKGRRALIEDGTEQANFVYRTLEAGNTIGMTTILLNNVFRRRHNLGNISYSAVRRYVEHSPYIVHSRRKIRKSGKEDALTLWARARTAFAAQLQEQLELGLLTEAERDARMSEFPAIYLDGIAWWDEHHKKIILGHTSVNEFRIYRNDAGVAALPSEGGKLAKLSPQVSVKYAGEARMLFGVAMVKGADGKTTGEKAAPFGYTGCQIVGIPAFEKAKAAEMARVRTLKRQAFDYEVKYGKGTEALSEALRMKLRTLKIICITELIDHVISESTRLYAGTERASTFWIFHDGLTAWWEPAAQAYIASKGFKDRQLRCIGSTNADNRYAGKLPGDSPEICRALDSFGFAHLAYSVRIHTALTSILAPEDPGRFSMGTPDQVESTLRRCWDVAPSSEQIIADIQGFPRVLQKIIDAKGCVVPDECLRSGRRERRADDAGDLTSRKRVRQRVATFTDVALHRSCYPILDLMAGDDFTAIADVVDAAGDDDFDDRASASSAFEQEVEEA